MLIAHRHNQTHPISADAQKMLTEAQESILTKLKVVKTQCISGTESSIDETKKVALSLLDRIRKLEQQSFTHVEDMRVGDVGAVSDQEVNIS